MRNGIIQFLLIFCAVSLLFFPQTSIDGAKNGLLLWSATITPTLLPFLLLSGFMQYYQTFHFLSRLFFPLKKLFPDINDDFFYTCILGFFCGCPLGAKIINDLILSGSYTKQEGQALLYVCNQISPMFTIGYTLTLILHGNINTLCFFFCLYFPVIIFVLQMPHQIFGRNHFVLTGFCTYTEVDVFDSGLDNKAGADGAGFCAVNRIITGIDAGKVEVGTDGLFAGTVQQCILLSMDRTAKTVPLSLMHTQFYSRTLADIAAIVVAARGSIIAGGDYHIIFYDHRTVFSFDAGASIGKCFGYIQVRIYFGYSFCSFRTYHVASS